MDSRTISKVDLTDFERDFIWGMKNEFKMILKFLAWIPKLKMMPVIKDKNQEVSVEYNKGRNIAEAAKDLAE